MTGGAAGRRERPREQHRINHRIRVPEIRVVLDDGTQLGIMQTRDAIKLAEEKTLDLVEISPRSHPPVCRIMDYGRFKYDQSKKQKQARKHASTMELKEIKFRPKTEAHDMDFKLKHVRRFLEEGNKCRLVIVFRGREITHPQTGKNVLDRVVEATKDIAQVEAQPNMEGRRMVMIIAPRAGVIRRTPRPEPVKEERDPFALDDLKPEVTPSRPAADKADAPAAASGKAATKVEPAERPARAVAGSDK
jgi:translation initiation factor IF-3